MQSTICWLQHVSTQFKNVGQIGSSLQAKVTFLTCLEVKPPFNIFWSAFPHVHHYYSPWFSLHLFFDSSPSLCPIHHDMKGIVPHKTAIFCHDGVGGAAFLGFLSGSKNDNSPCLPSFATFDRKCLTIFQRAIHREIL